MGIPGKAQLACDQVINSNSLLQEKSSKVESTKYDEEYMVVGRHIDSVLEQKIINFEYVDFSRLIPKDRVTKVEDHCFELVIKGGPHILHLFQIVMRLLFLISLAGNKHFEFIPMCCQRFTLQRQQNPYSVIIPFTQLP